MIVLADVDLDATLERMVQGCFGNAGQVCMAPEQIYVEEAAYNKFVADSPSERSNLPSERPPTTRLKSARSSPMLISRRSRRTSKTP